jgi:ATP-dependent DNA helicase RecG
MFADGTVLDLLQRAEDFIKRNTRTAMRIAGLRREDLPEYPGPVTREALVNALTHRDYFSRDAVLVRIFDDRMEVLSPGNLPMGLDLRHLGTVSRQRNPLTYRMMRDLELVEGLATGIPKMRNAMREAGLPEPVFEELGSFFRVTLYNKAWVDARRLNRRQRQALEHLSRNPSITSRTYGKLAGISRTVAVADLNDMVAKGLIRKVGRTRGAYYELAGRPDLSDIVLKDV